jgi:glutathionylspermidine synthase
MSNIESMVRDISMIEFGINEETLEPEMRVDGEVIGSLLKCYPYEWLVSDLKWSPTLEHDLEQLSFIEPAWKIVLSNKSILPMLWEMFPNHPNLLPAYFINPME